jgi:protein-L-isoaspartate(D-aspartate) O-methyltransferase
MFLAEQREEMVRELKKRKIIISKNVYLAMKKVPRHLFMPENLWHRAYLDSPQQIGNNQTISAPHMNAMMCEYLEIEKGHKILEIGTGSGYHSALLSELVGEKGTIFTIERHKELADNSRKTLEELKFNNIQVILGDGSLGLTEHAPFDRILVTAASPKILKNLLTQLSIDEGIICIPVGKRNWNQDLYVIKRMDDNYVKRNMCNVVFVPLIGKNGFEK